jgi:hypothetical protein
MRTLVYVAAFLFASAFTAHADVSPCAGLTFELPEACVTRVGLADRLAAFKNEIEVAQKLYGSHYDVRVHVFDSTSGTRFRATGDDVFSVTETDKDLKVVGVDIYVKRSFLAEGPEILFEHAVRHEFGHALNGDIPGFRPNGSNTEEAAEHRVLELVGEVRYREYLGAYFAYHHDLNVDFDAFVRLVRSAVPH